MTSGATPNPDDYDIAAREAEIIGKPPRILPIEDDEDPEGIEISYALISSSVPGAPRPEKVSPMLALMMKHRRMFRPHLALAQELFRTELPFRQREILILTVGWHCKAPFEWGEHAKIAKRAGLNDAEVQRIKHGSSAPGWDELDRAVIRAVEELFDNAMISDETWAVLARNLNEEQLCEIPIMVGQYAGVAFFQNSLRAPLSPGGLGLRQT